MTTTLITFLGRVQKSEQGTYRKIRILGPDVLPRLRDYIRA
jgi:hypothetical protein